MKVLKTLKTLKFWSKKKKKTIKNYRHSLSPPPPPPSCCCRHHHDGSHTLQPSAPPLPAWLEYEEQTYNQHLLASDVKFSGLPISYQARLDPEEDERRSTVPPEPSVMIATSGDVETNCSYQQYMVQNPVYTVTVLQSTTTDRSRSAAAVGCVFNIGSHLFRCFFPCFRIREV
ncbi:hypothetical protein L6452_27559 [Arctium lappa]|uniref:Uncharacterized protein n=1 Tax=Arctium lappa TaxID=4217 RepID=A0ACB9A0S8_ARCLA|nr:hypothetical protein L6452_27559 [Arctium lappa]